MLRGAHRSLTARFFAACLLVLAVSPVTAPFTTCDLSDFTHSHPSDSPHHPGRQMAELHLKAVSHIVTAADALPHLQPLETRDDGRMAGCAVVSTCVRENLQTVLRL
jgi:hypothetical protein